MLRSFKTDLSKDFIICSGPANLEEEPIFTKRGQYYNSLCIPRLHQGAADKEVDGHSDAQTQQGPTHRRCRESC